MAGQNKIHIGSNKHSIVYRVYAAAAVIAIIIVVSMSIILYMGRYMVLFYSPLIDATMEVKLEATSAHLWFEEIIGGDKYSSIEEVKKNIKNADWYARVMLEGGEDEERKYYPLKHNELRQELREVREEIAEFNSMTDQRWAMKDQAGIGSEIDQKYDDVFKRLLEKADDVESKLQIIINQKLRDFVIIQILIITSCIGVLILATLLFRSLIIRQIQNEIKVRKSHQQLDAMNQQLLAGEQQLKAANQQLTANDQQLRAANQQLLASDQQLRAANQQLAANEKALKQSEEFLNITGKTAEVGGWELDVETKAIRWTDQLYRIYELEPGNMPTLEEALNFCYPEDRGKIISLIEHAIEYAEPYETEMRIVTAKGRSIWAQAICKPYAIDGKVVKLIGTLQNITTRKKSESEREQLLKALASKNDELHSIVYISSHDLRTPLVNIQGFSDMLADHCREMTELIEKCNLEKGFKKQIMALLQEKIPDDLRFVISSAGRMKKLIDGLLKVSRIGASDINIQKIKMSDIISDVINTVRYKADALEAEVTFSDLPDCIGDRDQLTQVFTNLIDNSLKYLDSQRKGSIKIFGNAKDGECLYCVEDNGVGIDEAHQKKIFEIYHRLTPDGPVKGEGLGLTIVKRIIEKHSGSIRIESEPGVGSRFFVTLPNVSVIE